MPSLLSGSKLNKSSPSNFANVSELQYKLGPTPTTSTGYTLITDANSKAVFVSSLGNLQFTSGTVYSNIPNKNIQFIGTGTGTVIVSGPQINTSTNTGVLVVQGGVGISAGLYTGQDINVNGLQIGQGYQGYNNIVIRGVASTLGQGSTDGENSIAIGYNTLAGINSALNTIALGSYALGTGTDIANTISIGNGSLSVAGTIQSIFVGNISAIAIGSNTIVTVNGHGLSTGTEIVINGVVGTTELNGNKYLVNAVTPNTLELFSLYDPNLTTPIVTANLYVNNGTVSRTWTTENNIAIGNNAADSFYEGVDNLFIGHNVSNQFTTGSYNVFMGNDAVGNMTNGNFNISIDSNRLVDNRDSQIGIGSVFYYNGGGYLQLDTNVGLGLGDEATDALTTGALNVYGGVGISKSLFVGKNLSAQGPGTITLSPVGGNVIIQPQAGGTVTVYPESNYPGNMDNVYIGSYQPRSGHFTDLQSNTSEVTSTAASTSTTTGALTVAGGVGIAGTMYVGGFRNTATHYTLYYNTATNEITFGAGVDSAAMSAVSTNSNHILVNTATINTVYYPALAESIGGYSAIDGTTRLNYDTTTDKLSSPILAVTSSTASTSTTTGALTVAGGVGVQGSVYSQDGNSQENYLLYSPKVSVSSTVPTTATNRVGDIWIDLNSLSYYQWINDNGNKFWLQITIL